MRPYLELRKAAVWLQVQDEGGVAAHRLQTALRNDGHFITIRIRINIRYQNYLKLNRIFVYVL